MKKVKYVAVVAGEGYAMSLPIRDLLDESVLLDGIAKKINKIFEKIDAVA